MKTIKHLLFAAMLPFMALSLNSCTDYQDELDALDYRVTVLENLVNKMNTDMEAMEIIIDAMAGSDYITNVTQSSEGYIITFNNSGAIVIHDGVDGANGRDGVDGRDGRDAQAPNITIEQDTDGNWYWKLNGDWLTDNNGNRVQANGKNGRDGKDGKDGKDGQDGKDGKDGKDGVTPQVRINGDGIWEISTDGGLTWQSTGTPATGKDGEKGADANVIIKVVTHWSEGYVEFITSSGSFRVPLATS